MPHYKMTAASECSLQTEAKHECLQRGQLWFPAFQPFHEEPKQRAEIVTLGGRETS